MPDTPRTATGRKVVAIHGSALLDDVLGIEHEAIDALTAAVDMSHAWTPCTVCGSMPDDPEAAEPCEEPHDA